MPVISDGDHLGPHWAIVRWKFLGALFLESGLVDLRPGYYPIEPLDQLRPPVTLYEGDAVERLRALDPALIDKIRPRSSGVTSEPRPATESSRSQAIYGATQAEWNSLTGEERQALSPRLPARSAKMLAALQAAQHTGLFRWWLRSRIATNDPAYSPSIQLIGGLWYVLLDGHLITPGDCLLSYTEPPTAAQLMANADAVGVERLIYIKPRTSATAWRWRPVYLTPTAQRALQLSRTEEDPLAAETLLHYALTQARALPEDEEPWRTVDVGDTVVGGRWERGHDIVWDWGRGSARGALVTQEPVVINTDGIFHIGYYTMRRYGWAVSISHAEADGIQVPTLAVEQTLVEEADVAFPVGDGQIFIQGIDSGTMIRANPMKLAAFEPSVDPFGDAPVKAQWYRDGPGDAGTLEIIRFEAQAGVAKDDPTPGFAICGFGSRSETALTHAAADSYRFYCDRISLDVTKASTVTFKSANAIRGFNRQTEVTDTDLTPDSNPIGTATICDPAYSGVIDDINALPGQTAAWRTRQQRFFGLKTTNRVTDSQTNVRSGTSLVIPRQDAGAAYLIAARVGNSQVTESQGISEVLAELSGQIYDGLIGGAGQIVYSYPPLKYEDTTFSTGGNSSSNQYYVTRAYGKAMLLGERPEPLTLYSGIDDTPGAGSPDPSMDGWLKWTQNPGIGLPINAVLEARQSYQGDVIHTVNGGGDLVVTGGYPPGPNLRFSAFQGAS